MGDVLRLLYLHGLSTSDFAPALRERKCRGMGAPALAVGDGAKALRDVFPTAKEQRCWIHKTGNVLATL